MKIPALLAPLIAAGLLAAPAPPTDAQTATQSQTGTGTSGPDGQAPMQRRIGPGAGAPDQISPPSAGEQTATEALTGTGRMGADDQVPMERGVAPGVGARPTGPGTTANEGFPTSLDRPVPGQGTVGTPAQRRHPTEQMAEERLTEQAMVPDIRPNAPQRLPEGPAGTQPGLQSDRQTGFVGQQPGGGSARSPVLGGPEPDTRPLNPELRNRNPGESLP